MLYRKQVINLQINQILDGILLVVALWIAHALRYYSAAYFDFVPVRIKAFDAFFWLVIIIMPFGPLMLEMQGFYNFRAKKPLWRSVSEVLRAALSIFVIIAACVIFFRLDVPSRSVLLLFGALGALFVIGRERIMMARLHHLAVKEGRRERVVLAGSREAMESLRESFTPELLLEMEIVGEVDVERDPPGTLVDMLHEHSVGRVVFASGHAHMDSIQNAIAECEAEGVEVWLLADFIKTSIAKPDFERLDGRPMLVFRTTPEISWELLCKEVIDRIVAFVSLLLLSPLFLLVALLIRLTSPGPVFFTQMRGGRHGRPFCMWKFRTMVTDAEMRRAELAAFNQMSGPVFKVEDDPRITRVGYWLRRTSIDELPQLFNVLRGEMSLVGPRPLPIYEVEQIESGPQRRRLSVKPGLTCLWQIGGRNEVRDFRDWVRLDLEYIDNWSLWLDFRILLKTIPAVLRGAGAK